MVIKSIVQFLIYPNKNLIVDKFTGNNPFVFYLIILQYY